MEAALEGKERELAALVSSSRATIEQQKQNHEERMGSVEEAKELALDEMRIDFGSQAREHQDALATMQRLHAAALEILRGEHHMEVTVLKQEIETMRDELLGLKPSIEFSVCLHDQTVADFTGAAEEDFRIDLASKLDVPPDDILLTLAAGSVVVNSQVANLASEEAAAELVATMDELESLVDESKFGKCEVQRLPAVKLNKDMEQLRRDHEAAVARHTTMPKRTRPRCCIMSNLPTTRFFEQTAGLHAALPPPSHAAHSRPQHHRCLL